MMTNSKMHAEGWVAPHERITLDRLREMVSYDPETGILVRKSVSHKDRNPVGSPFRSIDRYGYCRLKVDRVEMRSHRAAWAIYFGEWPEGQIDHINGVRSDNRIANLRLATQFQNSVNRAMPSRNRHGTKGVTPLPSGKWQAQIKSSGTHYYLGAYALKSDAAKAYKDAATRLHGEFAYAGVAK